MARHLDPDPAIAVRQVAADIGTERPDGMAGFYYNPHSFFIATYGLPAFEESMAAMYALTKVFTAEFCIRPFITEYHATLDILREWASDPDEHVRRLVSEGTRPRLPWAPQLPQFRTDPEPVIELLGLLKDDNSKYVLRSVGNNLNDISKDHPDRVLQVASGWVLGHPTLVRRGLRTLIKSGDLRALEILGYSPSQVRAEAWLPARLMIGDSLRLEIRLLGNGRVLVDVLVDFVRANGMTSRKVFKGGEVEVTGSAVIRRSISFGQFSTRTTFPGTHGIAVLINGREQPLGTVEVVAQSPVANPPIPLNP
jgi:3-methyladenine DNA glycosylase AlkC